MSLVSACLKGLGVAALVVAGLTIRASTSSEQKAAPISVPATVPPSPDGIPLANAHAAAAIEPSAPDAWSGPRTGKEPTLSDRVVNYDI